MSRHVLLKTIAALLLLMLAVAPAQAGREPVSVPMTLEYPLVRGLMAAKAFTGTGESTVVLNEMDGCTYIGLWQPMIMPRGNRLAIVCHIKVRAGVSLMNRCVNPVDWEGYIELLEDVRLDPKTWQLAFTTVDSKLYTRLQGEPAKVTQVVWDLVKTHVHDYINRIGLNLTPPVKDLEDFLPLMFPTEQQRQVKSWLSSLRPGAVRVTPTSLQAELSMEVETAPTEPEESLSISQEQVERLIRSWQSYDSFLVFQINLLAKYPLTPGERRVLLDTLLDARHSFVAQLADPTPGRRDVVREQFVQSWDRLMPILRRHLMKDESRPGMSYLGYFTAADALKALDKVGPTLHLDISRNGLIRLAQLLAGEGKPVELAYATAVDPGLRRTLGLGPPLDESGPAFGADSLPLPAQILGPEPPPDSDAPVGEPLPLSPLQGLLRLMVGTAWASEAPPQGWQEIRPWLLTRANRAVYLERAKEALKVNAMRPLASGKDDPDLERAFLNLVRAAAWQESCLRQFITPNGQVTYLRSSNNTSVGMMQVNQTVWRGMYKPESLRWNVLYNIKAGVEILHLYLTRHGQEKTLNNRPLSPDLLAMATYAMYNGGPGQVANFLRRTARKAPNALDRVFAQKYIWVANDDWDQLARCLGE
jgi:hypothetical protein